MQANDSSFRRAASLFTGVALTALPLAAVSQAGASEAGNNFIRVSATGVSLSGPDSAFQSRTQNAATSMYGIEEFRFGRELGTDVNLQVDARALTGSEDYLAQFKVTKTDVGSVEVGYKSFRTYYDGIGGFFPINRNFFVGNKRDLHIDRGIFWAEARLAMPDKPQVTIRYSNELRDGQKDTSIWGDTDLTGLPSGQPISQVRKISPSYLDIDERHQTLETTVAHTIGKTALNLTVAGEEVNNDNTRQAARFPGEIRPFPTPPAGTVIPAINLNNEVRFFQREGIDAKTMRVALMSVTTISPTLTLRGGLSYQLLHSDINGERNGYTVTPTATGPVQVPATSNRAGDTVFGLAGNSKLKVYTATAALDWQPLSDLRLSFGLKGEDRYIRSNGIYSTRFILSGNPAVNTAVEQRVENSRVKEKVLSPEFKARYTGLKNVVLYTSVTPRYVNGDERVTAAYNPLLPLTTSSLTYNDVSENHEQYKLGANWYQSSLLTLRGELFLKDHKNKFIGYYSDAGVRFITGYKMQGVTLTAVLKPTATVSLTSRYIGQKGTMDVTTASFSNYDSMDAKIHTFAQSIDWTPCKFFYSQANVNVVFNTLNTSYGRAGVTASGISADNILQNTDNNYYTASLVAGFVVAKDTDAQIQCTYYKANNYNPGVAYTTVPYGAGAKDYTVTAGIKHKFSEQLSASAKVGYYSSVNDTTGGNNNYSGRLAYIALDYKIF